MLFHKRVQNTCNIISTIALVIRIIQLFFFFFFFNSILRPCQDYFSSYETGQSVVGGKLENPEKNHPTHLQAAHVASVGLEPTPDTAVR